MLIATHQSNLYFFIKYHELQERGCRSIHLCFDQKLKDYCLGRVKQTPSVPKVLVLNVRLGEF